MPAVAYEAENLIDAQLVCDLLISAGIPAQVLGAGLLGAAGELPAIGTVRVFVDADRLDAARALIDDWQAGEIPDEDELERLADQPAPDGELWA